MSSGDPSPRLRPAPPPPPPHIRLNSGSGDLISHEPFRGLQQNTRAPPPRSLTSPRPGFGAPGPSLPFSRSAAYAQSPSPGESTELLLPPNRSRTRRFRDDDSPLGSPAFSAASSRRTSWSSESDLHRDNRMGPFGSPFDDPRAPSRAGSDDDNLNTQTVSERYNILPSAGLLLFPEDVEKDDYLHNPDPNEKESRDCDIFTRRGAVNMGGLMFIVLGVFFIFIGLPILTFISKQIDPSDGSCARNPMCIDIGHIPHLKGIRKGLIDPDTPDSVKERKSHKGKTQTLVFSDEFNKPGRSFYEGDDPFWTAVDIWYGVTMDLEWYDPDAVTTNDGVLEIKFDAFQNHGLNYRSGMIQSWNQMCFKGGYLEASISLPGRGDISGFWPGFWTMGNLGRAGYASSTEGMWPYSYHDECDLGITKNQSDPDGLSFLPGMKLPACTCKGEDHPSPGKSRSAPELDALEASVGPVTPTRNIGSVSQSMQVAPFDIFWRPDYEFLEIYDHRITAMNGYCGGVFQQAVSGVSHLNNDWYEGKAYQTYAFEYEPTDDGYVTWYVGKDKTWTLDPRSLGPNGNIGTRVIPREPMYVIANFGMSDGFALVNLTGLGPLMPATMRLDYIRIYQDEGEELVTCDPPGYPTTDYIASHPEPYLNPNLTLWEDTGYEWPKNSFVDDCDA